MERRLITAVLALFVLAAALACTNNCSGQGICDNEDNICHCYPGYDGLDCSLLSNSTSSSEEASSSSEPLPISDNVALIAGLSGAGAVVGGGVIVGLVAWTRVKRRKDRQRLQNRRYYDFVGERTGLVQADPRDIL
mmetsp:Transcript_37632/g.97101  ORF Transcript_37632/g.97101 Transcript_37632/m.97101 type:complete len:136 (-) Transcript_37632:174-581(-)